MAGVFQFTLILAVVQNHYHIHVYIQGITIPLQYVGNPDTQLINTTYTLKNAGFCSTYGLVKYGQNKHFGLKELSVG